jgi:hypothetical protein
MHDHRLPKINLIRATTLTMLGCALVAACNPRHHVPHHVWTMFDIRQALAAGGNIAMGTTLKDGMPASAVLTAQPDGTATLNVVPTFSEGAPAAFVTTEIWINYNDDEVWLEPIYLQAVSVAPLTPLIAGDGTPAPLLIDVGPQSAFYSPFWMLDVANVGPIDNAAKYQSTRQLLDNGVPIIPVAPRACPLRPLDVLAAPAGGHMVEPTWNTTLDDVPLKQAMLDGTLYGVFDFGPDIFSVAAGSTVEPLPFFLFVNGNGPVPGAWRVAGVGPLFSGQPAAVSIDAATGWPQPHFGAFWRIYLATLPAGAGPFLAADHAGVTTSDGSDIKDFEGRVALDTTCFGRADFPTGCFWLDSQAKVETALGASNLTKTEIMGTCPLVFFDKKPVKR